MVTPSSTCVLMSRRFQSSHQLLSSLQPTMFELPAEKVTIMLAKRIASNYFNSMLYVYCVVHSSQAIRGLC